MDGSSSSDSTGTSKTPINCPSLAAPTVINVANGMPGYRVASCVVSTAMRSVQIDLTRPVGGEKHLNLINRLVKISAKIFKNELFYSRKSTVKHAIFA
jgi:hypothetical protein